MGKSIGRYEIQEELGRGGMATVYLATDSRLDRMVALKLMDQQLSSDPAFATRFEREAKTVAALEHSAIVSLYDFGEAEGWLYLVMRYMKGGTLKEVIAKGSLGLEQTYAVVRRIGSALDKAHGMGIIHRDLKPANILFDEDEEPFLSDFGIVKVAKGDAEFLTETGQTLGTYAYMSPEQLLGRDLDGRSDIYAMGIVLYEMLTGKHPFGEVATTSAAMVIAHTQEPIPEVTGDNPVLPAAFSKVIHKAMAKDPMDRFASGEEMATAVEAAMVSRPVAEPATGVIAVAVSEAIDEMVEVAPEPSDHPQERQLEIETLAQQPAEQAPDREEAALPTTEQPAEKTPALTAQPTEKVKRRNPIWVFGIAAVTVIILIVLSVVIIPSVLGPVSEPSSKDSAEKAEEFFREAETVLNEEQDPKTTITLLDQAIELNPNVAKYYFFRGNVLGHWLESYADGIQDLTRAIELGPSEADYYGLRGGYYLNTGQVELAFDDAVKAIGMDPDNVHRYLLLAEVYTQLDQPVEANEAYEQAIRVEPGKALPYIAYADALANKGLGSFEEAIDMLNICKANASEETYSCYWEQAQLYDARGLIEEAAADFQVYLDLVPDGECPECVQHATDYLK